MLMTSGLSGSGHQPPYYGRHFFIVLYSLFNAKYWKLINFKMIMMMIIIPFICLIYRNILSICS